MSLPPPPANSDSADTSAPSLVRTYRVWQGSNVFLFGGRLIFGPDVKSIFISIFLVIVPIAVFCALVARKLLDDFPHHSGWSIMGVVIALTLFVLITLIVTSGRDPGIVPRNSHPPEPDDYNWTENSNNGQISTSRFPRTRDVIVNGITVKVKYCDTCMLYRPLRASHCSVCDNCVERFDHHCPWVGQCIGLRNYRFYYMFVFSATLLCLYVHAFCWVYIVRIKDFEKVSIWRAMSKTIASTALIIYTFVCVWFVGGLAVFHTYLISTNQSTYQLQVKVNKLTSTKTQLPYSYYSLPYCTPEKIQDSTENLGEVLRGDRIENSLYSFKMREPQMCNIVCNVKLDAKTAKEFKEKISDEYRVNMILDNLPLVVPLKRNDQDSTVYQLGFHVGLKGQYSGSKEEKYFIHNHLAFTVKYHKDVLTESARIVGFEVKPFSAKHEYEGKWEGKTTRLTTCDPHAKSTVVNSNSPQEVEEGKEIIFTYDVEFQESDVKWASRWDAYLLMNDDQIHWFSIVNSLMIVLFLSGMVAMIMLRTLYRDIAKYNELETQEEAQEETGWKLVHGDVFRPPTNSDLLCVYVGTGVQFFGMMLVTMMFAVLGFLSPSNRGGLMTAMLLLWVFMGIFAGYSSTRLYKMFKGSEWKKVALRTATMFPAIVSAIFFVLNALIWGQKSSGAVPFGTMFALIFLWFGISVPLVFVGSYVGFKKPAIESPVKTNKIPRQIPEQAWYMNPVFSVLIGGILPFGAVFIELFFILTSIWLNQFYYIFGFLFLVFIILIVTCAEITIVLCYFQLCSEDYLWWWRSYLTSGSSALYLFLYATFYFFTKLEITKLVSAIFYFGYMLIASYAFFVVTGTIGFYACFWFTRLIYSSVKID